MIIVSQNKDVIVNFKNITSILIDGNVLDKTNTDFEITADGETLGYYKTEERAKEVLEEIVDTFIGIRALENIEKDLTFDENTQVRIRPKVYYMPED